MTTVSDPGDPGWAPLDACTLPTAERPLRQAEFDDLFVSSLLGVERSGDTEARLLLRGGQELVQGVRRLAAAESACCSFFTFHVTRLEAGTVALDVEVPSAYADVLAALLERADVARGTAS